MRENRKDNERKLRERRNEKRRDRMGRGGGGERTERIRKENYVKGERRIKEKKRKGGG